MAAEIDLKFADGEYLFSLRLPQILELQRVCGAGIFSIYSRVLKGRYVLDGGLAFGRPDECEAFINDIYETIRLALIGGGKGVVNGENVEVNAIRAKQLVETYCQLPNQPLMESWNFAAAILSTTIEGYEDAQAQKKSPTADATPPKASAKRKSSQTAQ